MGIWEHGELLDNAHPGVKNLTQKATWTSILAHLIMTTLGGGMKGCQLFILCSVILFIVIIQNMYGNASMFWIMQ